MKITSSHGSRFSETHTADAEFGYFDVGVADFCIFHEKRTSSFCFTISPENDNIFQYNTFNREVGGRAAPAPSLSEVVLISTYEELQLIVSVAVLIVAILNYTHKK